MVKGTIMVVKNSKLVWCITNFLILCFIAYHYRLEYFNNKVRIESWQRLNLNKIRWWANPFKQQYLQI